MVKIKIARGMIVSAPEELAALKSNGTAPISASSIAIPWVIALPGSFNFNVIKTRLLL